LDGIGSIVTVIRQVIYTAIYGSLAPAPGEEDVQVEPNSDMWQETYDQLFDDLARVIANELERLGAPPPSCVGYELAGRNGQVVAQANEHGKLRK
jgi:hypothetical protein